ncbi:MAG: hypothetical protein DWQ47_12750 [Acidobacteria bacterium]|nr:MAG: hypothetical protein DWQ32_00150 [Acidobacteriota bacterium]REK03046.1 MAG: hypothetical protein DWQ38_11985 [Acidobacteriota bacterium]REK13150.1 MAG: hypothetical protein DWQ43_05840 [Acidobacteriota bacterium]REK41144.1 MAG: hypothetical protein DWQ47_12750 [Acidobacteriota bacterium]
MSIQLFRSLSGPVSLSLLFTLFAALLAPVAAYSQVSQEVSEKEGIPVLIKHLPDWESKADSAIFVNEHADLISAAQGADVLGKIDFIPGTEAVISDYPQGRLVIVEFATPQASRDADERVKEYVDSSSGGVTFFYRRIGNYNVFLFGGDNEAAANALFDQIKYEKVVQWLGTPPVYGPEGESEREFITGASTLFISTVIVILSGLGTSLVFGSIAGVAYFLYREQRRANMTAFSDAGGMTRLNLDGLSEYPPSDRLLKE